MPRFSLNNRIIPLELKLVLFVGLLLILLLIGGSVFGATIFEDDFDSYTGFFLNGQGGWSDCQSYASWEISTTTTKYGYGNSVYSPQSVWGRCSEKTGVDIETGEISFWAKVMGNYVNYTNITTIEISGAGTTALWSMRENGDVRYYTGSMWVDVCHVQQDVWFWLAVEWDSDTDLVRYTCESVYQNSGWVAPIYDQTIEYFNKVRLLTTGQNTTTYIDEIEEINLCGFYENPTSCSDAGCSWYYSIYLQDYLCTPYYSSPDACGSFYNCPYCVSKITCEEQVQCEWTDKGTGDACYMTEPTTPIETATWEVPELENCNELSGVELLLCEIKNDISGFFMPTQEKIEQLYQTFGAFKTKFPFNYIGSLNDFFENISDSFNATKTIPIEILGKESNVNFSFWNSTTTIGGEGETFKNVIWDITTFVVLIAWFVWLISWVKRFF